MAGRKHHFAARLHAGTIHAFDRVYRLYSALPGHGSAQVDEVIAAALGRLERALRRDLARLGIDPPPGPTLRRRLVPPPRPALPPYPGPPCPPPFACGPDR